MKTKNNSKTFLITGGAGFIGCAVVNQLLKNTQHHVVNLDKLTYAANQDFISEFNDNSRYHFIHGDIGDKTLIDELLAKYQPDIIMNLAAETHVDRSIENPEQFIQTNIVGVFNLLTCATFYYQGLTKEKAAAFCFHQVSTDEVYGDLSATSPAFTEQSPIKPSSPYAASKASADNLVNSWHRTYNLPTIITRCSNNYGPHQFPEKLIPLMINNALIGKPLPIYGTGLQIRDWLFVEDHAHALIHTALTGDKGSTYNIGGNVEKTNLEIVQTLCQQLDQLVEFKPNNIKSFSELITHVDDRAGHDIRYAINASKIKTQLGWQPKTNFDNGLMNTVNWYLARHLNESCSQPQSSMPI